MWYTLLAKENVTWCKMAQTKNTTERSFRQPRPWHGLVLLSMLILAFLGGVPDSQGGWLTCPPRPPTILTLHRVGPRRRLPVTGQDRLHGVVCYVTRSWPQPVVRTLLLITLWSLSGRQGPTVLLAACRRGKISPQARSVIN